MEWVDGVIHDQARPSEFASWLAVYLRLPSNAGSPRGVLAACGKSENLFLDAIETVVRVASESRLKELATKLDLGNSAYVVRVDTKRIEMRVAAGVREQVQSVVAAASGSAGDHLILAWNQAYGRRANPAGSYADSIKAVESALAPLVSPQNARQTLGTMIKDVENKPGKWKFILDGSGGVDLVLAMMRTLWAGQTSRHGGPAQTRVETPAEAQAAVHLAATLVQYGSSGAFDRV